MIAKKLPRLSLLRELLDYHRGTGIFFWRARRRHHFPSGLSWQWKIWNARYADTPAGSVQHGYVKINILGNYCYAHRIAWLMVYGRPVPVEIDHINGNPGDNRIANLRAATPSANKANSQRRRDNTTGVKGVTICQQTGMYRVVITHNGKTHRLPRFATLEAAAAARREAAERLHGAFARHD